MTEFLGRWRERAGRLGRLAGGAGWGVLMGALAAMLAVQGIRARGEAAETRRQAAALDGQIEKLRRENGALREEIRALESDPMYLESLLRRRKCAAPGERLVE